MLPCAAKMGKEKRKDCTECYKAEDGEGRRSVCSRSEEGAAAEERESDIWFIFLYPFLSCSVQVVLFLGTSPLLKQGYILSHLPESNSSQRAIAIAFGPAATQKRNTKGRNQIHSLRSRTIPSTHLLISPMPNVRCVLLQKLAPSGACA
jgi:hypothetical protein